MDLKACIFERLGFISLGLVQALKSGKLHFWKWNLFYGESGDVGRIHFLIWYASGPGIPPKPLDLLEEDAALFYNAKRR